ncbi:hypothetical protein JXB28_06595 [Candidatus Woesearchaeota archaeon]|nr:hypothetical protein [Candidatus Woesearchaeota archaeon]
MESITTTPTAQPANPGQIKSLEERIETRRISHKWLIIVLVIFLIILWSLILMLHLENKGAVSVADNPNQETGIPNEKTGSATQESQDGIESSRGSTQSEAVLPEPEQKTTSQELSPEEIEQIKMDIITGKLEEVPEGLEMEAYTIIRDYLYECNLNSDISKKLECFEVYFLNDDASLMQIKSECLSLIEDKKAECLDQYYFNMGVEKREAFCEVIVNPELRAECLLTAE